MHPMHPPDAQGAQTRPDAPPSDGAGSDHEEDAKDEDGSEPSSPKSANGDNADMRSDSPPPEAHTEDMSPDDQTDEAEQNALAAAAVAAFFELQARAQASKPIVIDPQIDPDLERHALGLPSPPASHAQLHGGMMDERGGVGDGEDAPMLDAGARHTTYFELSNTHIGSCSAHART